MADGLGQAGGGNPHSTHAVVPAHKGLVLGLAGGFSGAFVPLIAPAMLLTFLVLAIVRSATGSPRAMYHWLGLVGTVVGSLLGIIVAAAILHR